MLGDLYSQTASPELFSKFMMNSEMNKSNRRKQSKPNRLLSDEKLPLTAARQEEITASIQVIQSHQTITSRLSLRLN